MEGRGEMPVRRGFDVLSPVERVSAVLGAVKEPVSKRFALELSGVDVDKLSKEEVEKLNGIFTGDQVKKKDFQGEERYELSEEAKRQLEENVDMTSVHGRIADVLSADLGI